MLTPPTSSLPRVTVYGPTVSRDGFAVRDFLSRTTVDFIWRSVDTDEQCRHLLGRPLAESRLPIVELPHGERLIDPSVEQIANALGWVSAPTRRLYYVSIYGAGPAGLSAAVYAASEGLTVALLERDAVGGQAGYSSLIENYLGFPAGVTGAELAERARQQAVKFGVELLLMRGGIRANFADHLIHAELTDGSTMVARSNICATGVQWRRLGLQREEDFLGLGVFYGAGTSEGLECAGREVFVVGGGNSAGQAVLNLATQASHVTMVVRGPALADTLSDYLVQRILKAPNITVRLNSQVTALHGDTTLHQVELTDSGTGARTVVDTDRLFVCIGGSPDTTWAKDTPIVTDGLGYLITGADLTAEMLAGAWTLQRAPFYLETSVPGSFAAGDVRHGSVKRVASAVGEGAMAVTFAHRYLAETFS